MNLVEHIRKHSRSLVRQFGFFRSYYEDTNATYSETHALVELSRFEELEVGELGRILNVDKTGSSKILAGMKAKGWVRYGKAADKRKKLFVLTAAGKKVAKRIESLASHKIERALHELDPEKREHVLKGLEYLSGALKSSAARAEYEIRPCTSDDDKQMASIVKRALKDLGFAGPGTAAADPSLNYLSTFNNGPRQCFLVAVKDGRVMGGAGIMPLVGEKDSVCELVRMFLHPEARGSGLAQILMDSVLSKAKGYGYEICYLETTDKMKAAQSLYLRNGFHYIKKRRGQTGHFACKVLMEKSL